YARAIIRREQFWGSPVPMTVTDYDDFVLWVTLGIILGGRIGYVLFYNPSYFATHPLESFQLWKGGMSFHGGFLGCVLAVVLFARHRCLSILSLGDITCAAGTIGIFLGRIANFINGELWGRMTDVPWAMIFPTGGPFPRHPSQLYEAFFEGIVLFSIMMILVFRTRLRERPGFVGGAFLVCYGLARSSLEFFREPGYYRARDPQAPDPQAPDPQALDPQALDPQALDPQAPDPQAHDPRARDPFGRAGDFITAPEISQIFGELLGLWAAETWRLLGAPAPVNLVELGPGRGTLMADALRAIGRAIPEFRAALAVHLI